MNGATSERPTYYLTTPIYYPSGKLHIGHSYTTIAADTIARYKRLEGYDVMFLTGTDEHGQKIQDKAEENGLSPQEYVDGMVADIKALWSYLDISYDRFIRTTDGMHEKGVQAIFSQLHEKGDIYLGEYEGWYCKSCEAFWTDAQLVEGRCPDCGGEVSMEKEESYFFRLSKYTEPLLDLFTNNPNFLQPTSRAKEMINNFLKPGLEDLAVSRTSFDWGIKVPFDDRHVIYVWVDALANYITALGYPATDGDYARYWPADVHLIGKEIVRFHTLIWPAILMALDLPLPRQVFAHGWLLFKESKMSKSKGNVVDPILLCDRYGVDAIRYFLLREVPFGSDGSFSNDALVSRINSDLANDLGNLVSRSTAMLAKYFGGVLPPASERVAVVAEDSELLDMSARLMPRVRELVEQYQFSLALEEIWRVVGRANKYIDETRPWVLAKDEAGHGRLAEVLHNLGAVLRQAGILLEPFMPQTGKKILVAIGVFSDPEQRSWASAAAAGLYEPEGVVEASSPIFPRLDMEKEIEAMNRLLPDAAAVEETDSSNQEAVADKTAEETQDQAQAEVQPEADPWIDYDDFAKVKLRVGKVLTCEPVKKSTHLLQFDIDLGDKEVHILSGIAESYQPADLVGKQVIVVENLRPRKMMGQMSQGMILSAEGENDRWHLLEVDGAVPPGAEVS